LLLLLAVLMPVRGVVAAAMACPPAHGGTPAGMSMDAGSMHEHSAMSGADAPAHAGHGEHAGHSGSAEKCHLCCDFCSATPMFVSQSPLPVPQGWSLMSFPDVFAPAPSFLSGGQERPPRSS